MWNQRGSCCRCPAVKRWSATRRRPHDEAVDLGLELGDRLGRLLFGQVFLQRLVEALDFLVLGTAGGAHVSRETSESDVSRHRRPGIGLGTAVVRSPYPDRGPGVYAGSHRTPRSRCDGRCCEWRRASPHRRGPRSALNWRVSRRRPTLREREAPTRVMNDPSPPLASSTQGASGTGQSLCNAWL